MRYKNSSYTLDCKGKLVSLDRPLVMGILNATDDSFYAASRVSINTELAGRMLGEGADFLDVGGQSTRPGAVSLSAAEEADRVVPVIEAIVRHYPTALVSVDTYHSAVARAAVAAGAVMVNDISAGLFDPAMLSTVAALRVPYIAMHMQGTPQTMQADPRYGDVGLEVCDFLAAAAHRAVAAGIHDVILDPGFGFGKTAAHNFRLLNELDRFAVLERPLLVGLSRKSMIYTTLGVSPEGALNGTTALHMAALMQGARILRVHDVAPAVEVVRLYEALHS